MKRIVYPALALALSLSGAAWAQSPTTSAPPGGSQQREPQPANNDLQNPGNPQDQVNGARGTTGSNTGSSTGSNSGTTGTTGSSTYNNNSGTGTTGTTGSSTDTTGTSGSTTGTTGSSMDSTGTSGSTTGTTGSSMDTTGTGSSTDTTGTSGRSTRRGHLPRTGSNMPLVGMIGLLAMASALGLRAAKRNA